jgi:hypothetical protein
VSRRLLLGGLAGAAGVLAGLALVHLTRDRIEVGGAPGPGPRLSPERIDHAPLADLLDRYVDGQGLVAYRHWRDSAADRRALEQYLESLGQADLAAPADRPAQLSFWINAYNALTLKGILDVYPTTSIRAHTGLVGFNLWRDLVLRVDGRPYSLDQIEHEVLRPMGEPRIHFALVCAARGCPPLRNEAYRGDRLEAQFADNARRFFARPENFRADPARRTVYLSQLFNWYGSDFAATPAELLRLLRPHFPPSVSLDWIDEPDVSVEFLDYDWSLNDQQPAGR